MPSFHLLHLVLSFSRKFDDIGRQLQLSFGEPEIQRLAGRAQNLKDTSELLRCLGETIFGYQVCLSPGDPCRC